ncbi:MAG: biotin--[acetyl-CoA-carboxylase] ligase [Methanomassiliicoccales archaeon]|nr:biotin--[acetyl-CoA-carboxylase] ligase [Methanomassiliicoccales archaeon]
MTIVHRIVHQGEVASTNDEAKARGKAGAAEGLVIVAESQSAGKGRLGRTWSSPPGGLYLSLLLRPQLTTKELLRMTVYSCVPVAQAIEEVTGLRVQVKWPNDLELEGRKLGGILVEGVSKLNRMDFVVLGIGINVNAEPATDQVERAVSLRAASCHEVDQEQLLASILQHLDRFYSRLKKGEVDEAEYKRRSSVLGRKVEANLGGKVVRGKALRVLKDGGLVVRSDEGPLVKLSWVSETTLRLLETEEASLQ